MRIVYSPAKRLLAARKLRRIRESGLFDREWYLATNPDVATGGVDPLLHYLFHGAQEGRAPNPTFDSGWYLAANPDVAAAGINPLIHYVDSGAPEGRLPHPLFRSDWYLAARPEVEKSGENPLAHYLRTHPEKDFPAAVERLRRGETFDTGYYREQYPDLGPDDDLFVHFLLKGEREGAQPYRGYEPPANGAQRALEGLSTEALIEKHFGGHPLESGLFNREWYQSYYPDVGASGADPLMHYLLHGALEGRNPNPNFDSAWYLANNPDVAAAHDIPLEHYLLWGAREGRRPHPMFRSDWYIAAHPEIPRTGENPLLHYLRTSPEKDFPALVVRMRGARTLDAQYYREQYPELGPDDDPVIHFLLKGEREGARPYRGYDAQRPAPAQRKASPYVSMASSLVQQFSGRVSKYRSGQRLTWVTPNGMYIETVIGVFRRFIEVPSAQGKKNEMSFALDPDVATAVVIPIVAPQSSIWSFSMAVQGSVDPEATVALNLCESSAGAPVASAVARFERTTSRLVWDLNASGLKKGRRYFLYLKPDRPTGAEFSATEFSAEAFAAPRIARITIDTERALPARWSSDFGRQERAILVAPAGRSVPEFTKSQLLNAGLTAGADPTIEIVNADRADVTALDAVGRSPIVVVEKSLVTGTAFGMPTTDLLRSLKMQGTRLAVLENGTIARYAADRNDAAEAAPPHVAIVTILYRKAGSIAYFLQAVYRQTYPGPITVVIVDDCSPDSSFAEIEAKIQKTFPDKPPNIAVKIVRNTENLGNCLSRNAGIAACPADIYVMIDADCLMNSEFVRAHVAEHVLSVPDAVLGPYNIETGNADGFKVLLQLEGDPKQVLARSNLQDSLFPAAFVNTVTRNLSIRKQWLDASGGFDPMLSYSAKPDSGFGWEDVDIGARIFAGNGKVRFTPHAFSVHMTHASSLSEDAQARGSAKNFRYLADKNDVIKTMARHWYIDTADRIVNWAANQKTTSPDIEALKAEIAPGKARIAPLLPYLRKEKPRYRIVTHRWHAPHQREIYKLPCDFTLLTGTGTGFTNGWSYTERPLPPNARMINVGEFNPSDYDMAIVHFDENVLCPDLSNGVLGTDWGRTFQWFLENVRLPMVAVCHGTVPFVGQYAANPDAIETFEIYEEEADRLRDTLANVRVVVNSHQAASEWKFRKMRTIWHGLDPQEFQPGSHDRDIISHGVDIHRPHYRGAHALRKILSRLEPELSVSSHKHTPHNPVPLSDRRFGDFAFASWREHLGRHKIYLNTTLRSPMPRSRTEAMLCGVIPVTLDNHDASRFIENGKNGFYSSSPDELADQCLFICRNPVVREKMSRAARATAADTFNHDRFLSEWATLVNETVR